MSVALSGRRSNLGAVAHRSNFSASVTCVRSVDKAWSDESSK